jgi:hypothetical protein
VRTMAQDAFGRALSLGPMRDKPVEDRAIYSLALAVVRERGMAADAGPALEGALEKLSDHLLKCIRDPGDLDRALEFANSVANAAQRDEDLRKADAVDSKARRGRDQEAEQFDAGRRRQAADARPDAAMSPGLASLLAEYPNPSRPIAAR